MENYHASGVISQNHIDKNPGRQITRFGNGKPSFIGLWDCEEQLTQIVHRINEEEIIYG